MMTNSDNVSRRSLVKGAAWSAPTVLATATVPAYAASAACPTYTIRTTRKANSVGEPIGTYLVTIHSDSGKIPANTFITLESSRGASYVFTQDSIYQAGLVPDSRGTVVVPVEVATPLEMELEVLQEGDKANPVVTFTSSTCSPQSLPVFEWVGNASSREVR